MVMKLVSSLGEFVLDAPTTQITMLLMMAGCVYVAMLTTCAKKPKSGAKAPPVTKNPTSSGQKDLSKSSVGVFSQQQDSAVPKSQTQPDSKAADKKPSSSGTKKEEKEEKKVEKKKSKTKTKEEDERVPDNDYGEVAEPTQSQRKRREQQLEQEKADKIKKGFYQSKSDDDDTLDPIKSLKHEDTQTESTKKSCKKKKPKTTEQKTQ